jgi:hypothetical protein
MSETRATKARIMSSQAPRDTRHRSGGFDGSPELPVDSPSSAGLALPDLKNRRLRLLVLIVFAGTTASLIFHYLTGSVLHWNHVSASFLVGTRGLLEYLGNTSMDLTGPLQDARASVHGVPWFAPTPLFHVLYVVVLPLGRIGALLLQSGVFLAGLTLLLWRTYLDSLTSWTERITYFLILVVLSYPVLFVLERGNVEMLLFVVIAGFFYLYYVKRSVWCVGLLAVAISLKMYPAVFIVLLLADRRYKWALSTILSAAIITLGSIVLLALFLPGSLLDYIHISVKSLRQINYAYVAQLWGLPYGHSLWGLLVSLAGLAGIDQTAFVVHSALPYTIVVFLAFAALAVFVIRFVRLQWQRVALLTVAALALPTVSADYRLLYAYLPLAMLLNTSVRTRIDTVCIVLLGCLLIPTDYVYGVLLRNTGWLQSTAWQLTHASISVVIYPLVMLTLAAVVVWDALAEHRPIERRPGGGHARPADHGLEGLGDEAGQE